jgi:hypothetical protein
MSTEDFERLNALSKKAINDIVTPGELMEFNNLLSVWSESTEYNSLPGFSGLNPKGSMLSS